MHKEPQGQKRPPTLAAVMATALIAAAPIQKPQFKPKWEMFKPSVGAH
jgi:hypothetical protein